MRSLHYLVVGALLAFSLDLAAARRVAVRQDNGSSVEATQTSEPSRSEASEPSTASVASSGRATQSTAQASNSQSNSAASSTIIITSSFATQAPSATSSNAALSSATASPDSGDGLPIQPKLTPAMGLAGVVMLISGVAYTVIGIKNKWLYVFCSAAYLTALAITVLIEYLINPPVSDAVQGAFFVAVFVSGMLFGGLSLLFSDITEGLGCLLGGFCLSMWFLTLKEGGLITSTTGRAVLIGVMSFLGFSLSFSHYTRTYGLIVSISFAGATITVLGIDCLSRAGWKEFWLYIWNLNSSTFPLNTNTYPMTRAIRVELAAVILISACGLISQFKLWKLVKERREKQAQLREERDRNLKAEEEEVGRKIEDDFERDRAQWEATYGNKPLPQDSVVGSTNSSIPKSSVSIRELRQSSDDSVEMADMSPLQKVGLKRNASQSSHGNVASGPHVTVTVLQDDQIQQIDTDGNPVASVRRSSARLSGMSTGNHSSARDSAEIKASERGADLRRSISARSSLRSSVPPTPTVVPLPFTIPQEEDEDAEQDNASVSAVPESVTGSLLHGRRSLSKRLSGASALNRMSSASDQGSESQEALLVPHDEADRASSLAATLDDEHDTISLSEHSLPHSPLEQNFEEDVPEAHIPFDGARKSVTLPDGTISRPETLSHGGKKVSRDATEVTKSLEETSQQPEDLPVADERPSLTTSTDPKAAVASPRISSISKHDSHEDTAEHSLEETKSATRSGGSQVGSQVESLMGHLPAKLSKAALSYRTNEWAKHLEAADVPELEELQEPGSPGIKIEHRVEDPTINTKRGSSGSTAYRNSNQFRSVSTPKRFSQESRPQLLSRTPSAVTATSPTVPTSAFGPGGVSRNRTSSTPLPQQPLVESPVDDTVPARLMSPPPPRDTLMGKRESLMKNKFTSQSFANHTQEDVDPENMTLAQRRDLIKSQKPPSASQQWKQSSKLTTQGFDSHQPRRESRLNQGKREEMLANWRESVRKDATPGKLSAAGEEARRTAMLHTIRQKEMEKQQAAAAASYREQMMDSRMRSTDMLDAHREAMRRMQANANRKT